MAKLTVVEPAALTVLQRLVDDFLAHCRAKGHAPKTMEAYTYPLKGVFLPWCAREGVTEASEVTKRLLDRLSAHLLEEGGARGPLSKHSVHSYLRPVNHFLYWAREDGAETTGRAQLPKLPRTLLDVLSRDEIRAMEEASVTERDALILRVLADTGIRVGELVRLRTGDVIGEKNERYLKLRGKGDRERRVPLTPGLAVRIRRYVEKRRPKEADTDRLFVSLRRRPMTGRYEPLTESGIQPHPRVGRARRPDQEGPPSSAAAQLRDLGAAAGMNPLILKDILGH